MPWLPRVSIIIPVYNGTDYLAEAINSALEQTYRNVEVIVVNDGSTDNGATDTLARSYGDKITYYAKPNEGIAKTLNFGIEKMTGEYFSWLSHDDVFAREKIATQIAMLRGLSNRNVIIYSDYNLIDSKSALIGERVIPHIEPDRFYYSLFLRFPVHACTSLIPKAAFVKVGLFNPHWGYLQDTDMWFRMAPHFPFIHTPEKLASVRTHPNQGTVTRSKQGYTEGNKMYTDQMAKLTPAQIQSISGLQPYDFYMVCAESFKSKSYFLAAFAALNLARRIHANASFRSTQILGKKLLYKVLQNLQHVKHLLRKK